MGKLTKGKDLMAEHLLIGKKESGSHNLDSTELRKLPIKI
jgi:hypothetical protein